MEFLRDDDEEEDDDYDHLGYVDVDDNGFDPDGELLRQEMDFIIQSQEPILVLAGIENTAELIEPEPGEEALVEPEGQQAPTKTQAEEEEKQILPEVHELPTTSLSASSSSSSSTSSVSVLEAIRNEKPSDVLNTDLRFWYKRRNERAVPLITVRERPGAVGEHTVGEQLIARLNHMRAVLADGPQTYEKQIQAMFLVTMMAFQERCWWHHAQGGHQRHPCLLKLTDAAFTHVCPCLYHQDYPNCAIGHEPFDEGAHIRVHTIEHTQKCLQRLNHDVGVALNLDEDHLSLREDCRSCDEKHDPFNGCAGDFGVVQ